MACTVATASAMERHQRKPFFLGQHVFYLSTYGGITSDMFSGVRIWVAERTTWAQIEPERDRFDFSVFDRHVAEARRRDLDVIHTLGQTPRWAAARPDEPGNMGPGAASEPAEMSDWARYVHTVASRYKGAISAYEIMNEPRVPDAVKAWSPGFFSGSSTVLANMTRIAAVEIKQVDPSAKIICPSMDGSELGLRRLDKYLSTGAGKYCDVIGFHYYLRTLDIGELRMLIRRTKEIMARHGLGDLPLWNTETGILVKDSGYNLKPKSSLGALSKLFDSKEAARFAARFLLVSHAYGVERTYWFAHDSSSMGSTLADKRLNRLNGLGKALTRLNGWLSGRSFHHCRDAGMEIECRVLDRGKWIGNIYSGPTKSARHWRRMDFQSMHFLDGDAVQLNTMGPDTPLPGTPDDVVFLAR